MWDLGQADVNRVDKESHFGDPVDSDAVRVGGKLKWCSLSVRSLS